MKIILALLSLLYAISPYDIIPDFLPGWGWIDDLIVLGFCWWYLSNMNRAQMRYGDFYARGGRRNYSSSPRGDPSSRQEREQPAAEPSAEASEKDAYSILGVGKTASEQEIRQAYRELANKYHPDKVSHLGEEFRELAERRFREIQEAYKILSSR